MTSHNLTRKVYISEKMNITIMVFCPGCYSNVAKKNGYDRMKVQRYKCLRCNRNFTEKTDTQLSGMRYPKTVISYALVLHFRLKMPYRNVADSLRKKGIRVSYVTLHNWGKKFGGVFERTHGKFLPYTRIWSISSGLVSMKGDKYYFSAVRDSNRNILGVLLSKSQVKTGQLLEDAYKLTGFKPATIMGSEVDVISPAKMDVKV